MLQHWCQKVLLDLSIEDQQQMLCLHSHTLDKRPQQTLDAVIAGVEYLRTVSVANNSGTAVHNVPGNLQSVRVVSPVPGDDNFTSLDRVLSASSFESMHSIDHGSLGLDSTNHQYAVSAEGGGPWVASARAVNPPGRYEAFNEPGSANIRRPAELSTQAYSGPNIAVHYEVCTQVTSFRCF